MRTRDKTRSAARTMIVRGLLALAALGASRPHAQAADVGRGQDQRPMPPVPQASVMRPLPLLIRSGQHAGFGRLVFDLPPDVEPLVRQSGTVLRVVLSGTSLTPPSRIPSGVRDVSVSGDTAMVSLDASSSVRLLRLGPRLVIDVFPPAPMAMSMPMPTPTTGERQRPRGVMVMTMAPDRVRSVATVAARPETSVLADRPVTGPRTSSLAGQSGVVPEKPVALAPSPQVATGTPPDAASRRSSVAAPIVASQAPVQLAAQSAAAAGSATACPGNSLVLPFAPTAAASSFRRGGDTVLVFDEARPIDLAALNGNPIWSRARVKLLPDGTVVLLPLRPEQAATLTHALSGWCVTIIPAPPPLRAINPVPADGRIVLPVEQAGHVVNIVDPATGGVLMVGTEAGPAARQPPIAAPADVLNGERSLPQAVPTERRSTAFTLLATTQGVAVAADADDVVLRPDPDGFVLEAGAGHPLSLEPADVAPATADLARRFDLPSLPRTALRQRLLAAQLSAAMEPPQNRGRKRLLVAEAMLALGMGAEAQALVRVAGEDDPRLQHDPQAVALGAAAAILAGRLSDAGGLDDPALVAAGAPGADEMMLWQALRRASVADPLERPDPVAAQMLAPRWALLDAYPPGLRARLLPLAIRTMTLGGEGPAAARALAAHTGDPALAYDRALFDWKAGRVAQSLSAFDTLAGDPDRDVHARAATHAVMVRFEDGVFDAKRAADALEPLIYAWRGDARELAVRLQVADLRMRAGQFAAALTLLRETADPVLSEGWPDQRDAVRARLAAAFAEAIDRDRVTPLPPLAFVDLVQDNADLLPNGTTGQLLAERMADRLSALDLPDQAGPILEKLMRAAPSGAPRAALGGRLAALDLEQGEIQAALVALSASTADGLPPALLESRTLTFARATAARGDLPAASGALEALNTPAADDLRAHLLEQAGQWPQAEAALLRVASRIVAPDGTLNAAQGALLLRLATAASQAGDGATLDLLRARDVARLPPGHDADLLRVLTQGPVATVADLPRARAETALDRVVLK